MTNDPDTLATALYVRTDDLLRAYPDLAPWRPAIGLQPRLTDAELVTLAVMQALLGYTSESRWLRHAHAHAHLHHLLRYLPGQSGYNRGLRAATTMITTGAKADERQTLLGILAADPHLSSDRPGQTVIGDRHYYGAAFEADLAAQQVRLLRPARTGEPERAGTRLFTPLRQTIESINRTFKAQRDLERHGGHTPAGVMVRVSQRVLALTAAIWHNDHTGAPVHRSPTTTDLRIGHLGWRVHGVGAVPSQRCDFSGRVRGDVVGGRSAGDVLREGQRATERRERRCGVGQRTS